MLSDIQPSWQAWTSRGLENFPVKNWYIERPYRAKLLVKTRKRSCSDGPSSRWSGRRYSADSWKYGKNWICMRPGARESTPTAALAHNLVVVQKSAVSKGLGPFWGNTITVDCALYIATSTTVHCRTMIASSLPAQAFKLKPSSPQALKTAHPPSSPGMGTPNFSYKIFVFTTCILLQSVAACWTEHLRLKTILRLHNRRERKSYNHRTGAQHNYDIVEADLNW